MGSFEIAGSEFRLNGQKFKLVSGAIHYFRVPREYWRDRLEKLSAMGCNTVETYLPWNLHEPHPGEFNFGGALDLEAFLSLAASLGLWVILRPGPYVCGEFEFGGLPWWLLKDRSMRLRSTYPGFLAAVDRYYDELLPRLAPLQIDGGGPVIAMQVENEYGYYGNDKTYLRWLADALVDRGVVVPLFTSDGPWGRHLETGRLDGVLQTANFGSNAPAHFTKLAAVQDEAPLVCMEFWMGWFDAWGDEHHTRDPADAAATLGEILDRGHVNLYVFHGGTNFGFTAGANHHERYAPDVTSYDYDAPLTEDGRETPKYRAFRDVIGNHVDVPVVDYSTNISTLEPRELRREGYAPLVPSLSQLAAAVEAPVARSMEDLGQGYGYVDYRVRLDSSDKEATLNLHRCADWASVFLDGELIAVREHHTMSEPVPLQLTGGEHVLDVLVENQGRVNFGHRMDDQRKGIDGGLLVDGCALGPVTHFGLPLDTRLVLDWAEVAGEGPGFHRFVLDYDPGESHFRDAFLDMSGWGKGVVLVNGFNLGRFWELGPQRTLYLPGPFLQPGGNEVFVFETEGRFRDVLPVRQKPVLS